MMEEEGHQGMVGRASRKRRRLLEYRVCPHCKKTLNLKKFQEHRRLFFDAASQVWTKEVDRDTSSDSCFELSDFEEDLPSLSLSTKSAQLERDEIDCGIETDSCSSSADHSSQFQEEENEGLIA